MTVPLTKESNVDVLVIGAGPAGVMAANALAKAGVHVRIIDQRCALPKYSPYGVLTVHADQSR